jgi:hypothetical protein
LLSYQSSFSLIILLDENILSLVNCLLKRAFGSSLKMENPLENLKFISYSEVVIKEEKLDDESLSGYKITEILRDVKQEPEVNFTFTFPSKKKDQNTQRKSNQIVKKSIRKSSVNLVKGQKKSKLNFR